MSVTLRKQLNARQVNENKDSGVAFSPTSGQRAPSVESGAHFKSNC